MNWLSASWHKICILLLLAETAERRIIRFCKTVEEADELYERRKGERRHMGILSEGEMILGLIPKLEKVAKDLEALSIDPNVALVKSDIIAIVSEIKSHVVASSNDAAPVAQP